MQRVQALLREHGPGTAAEVGINVLAPLAIYSYLRNPYGDVNALLASMAAPLAWSAFEFVRRRRIDGLSLLVLTGIVLSLLAFIGGGSVRFLQLRENLVNAIIGAIFLVSAAIRKPLIYQLALAGARRKSAAGAAEIERLRDNVHFRRTMMLMTIVWGTGLVAETAFACVLVFSMSIQAYLVVSPILAYGTIGALGLWTAWYGNRQRRRSTAAVRSDVAAEPKPDGL